jgi:pimeloyl-ACP methyl ester carboxylesterase
MDLNGTAAGVPFVALPPSGGPRPDAPAVIAYHLLDAPRTPQAFAAAVPLHGLDAWKIYFGLPLSGARLPAGGADELWQMLMSDAVLEVHQHVTLGALKEFPAAYAEARTHLGISEGVPLGVMGGSMGGAAAQLVLADSGEQVSAAVLINPVVQLRNLIDALSAQFGAPYVWSPQADEVAEKVDFVRRADKLRETAIRFITGADDTVDAILAPVDEAVAELQRQGATVDHQVIQGMAHALADEPGTDAAPQTPHAATVDRLAAAWFREHLSPDE